MDLTLIRISSTARVQRPDGTELAPAQLDGYEWPPDPIVFPASWMTSLKWDLYVRAPQVLFEVSKDGEEWEEAVAYEKYGAVRGGSPPTDPPAPPSPEAVAEAAKRGIFVSPPGQREKPPFAPQKPPAEAETGTCEGVPSEGEKPSQKPRKGASVDAPPEGLCHKCGGPLSETAKREGHTTHKAAGERCLPKSRRRKKGTDAEALTPPE